MKILNLDEPEVIEKFTPQEKKEYTSLKTEVERKKFVTVKKERFITIQNEAHNEKEYLLYLEAKISCAQGWLVLNLDNPNSKKVKIELNALQVEASLKRKIINNLNHNLPSHGGEILEQNVKY